MASASFSFENYSNRSFVFKMDMLLMLRLVRCGVEINIQKFKFFFSVEKKGSLEIEERT